MGTYATEPAKAFRNAYRHGACGHRDRSGSQQSGCNTETVCEGTSVTDLVILGELLPEGVMPMHRFLVRYPLPEDETVLPKGEQPVVKKVKVVPCASGLKCIWVKRNKPAPATGRSRYCTKVCAQSDLARQRRLTVTPTAPEVVGSLLATA